MDATERLRWRFCDGGVTDLLDARSLHGSPVSPLGMPDPFPFRRGASCA
jgi:hypothetical protein